MLRRNDIVTKNEAAILNYIKLHKDCTSHDVIENAKTPDHNRYVSAKDRLQLMIDLGYISGDTPNPKINEDGSVHTLTITALGLHELDEFLENQSRIYKAEIKSSISLFLSALAIFVTIALFVIERII